MRILLAAMVGPAWLLNRIMPADVHLVLSAGSANVNVSFSIPFYNVVHI